MDAFKKYLKKKENRLFKNDKNKMKNKNILISDKLKKFNNLNNKFKSNIKGKDNLIIKKIGNNKIFKKIAINNKFDIDDSQGNKKINKFDININKNKTFIHKKDGHKTHNGKLEEGNRNKNKKVSQINGANGKQKASYDYYELNNLEYLEAKKHDKRNCFKIYWSFLKREHSIIFTFRYDSHII